MAATATALAFAIGTLAIPTLHLAFHALPHDHVGSEIHYHLAPDHERDHDGEDHHHAIETHDEADHHADHRDHQPLDPHHGEGSVAHFSLALSDTPAAPIDLALIGFAEQGRVAPPQTLVFASARASAIRFRGPPAVG